MILYGKPVADALLKSAKKAVASLESAPKLVIITNPNDNASAVYVKNKLNACAACGIDASAIPMPDKSTTNDYLRLIDRLNKEKDVTGIIVQLPLIDGVNEEIVAKSISKQKDVDGFLKDSFFPPCTPAGIIHMLDYYKGKNFLKGKNAVVIGRSEIVGKPMANLLLSRDATVTICHSKTQDISAFTKQADVVVCAVGKAKFLTREMVKPGATIIDVGINRIDGKLVGDCDFENLKDICDITPVPGGVGPMTVATLVHRLPALYLKQQQKDKHLEK